MRMLCVLSVYLFSSLFAKIVSLTSKNIIILILYINFASVPNLYFILDGFEKYKKFPKVLLTRGF